MQTHGFHFIIVLVIFMTIQSNTINLLMFIFTSILSAVAFAIKTKYESHKNVTFGYIFQIVNENANDIFSLTLSLVLMVILFTWFHRAE